MDNPGWGWDLKRLSTKEEDNNKSCEGNEEEIVNHLNIVRCVHQSTPLKIENCEAFLWSFFG